MAQQQQQQGGGGGSGENSMDILWLVAIIVVGLGLTWYFGKSYISAFVFQVRWVEIVAVEYLIGIWNSIASLVHLPIPNTNDLTVAANHIQANGSTTEFGTLKAISDTVGNYLRYPILVILGILAVVVFQKNVSAKFSSKFTMPRLRKLETTNWPYIIPVAKLNLVDVPLDEGPWAMSTPPLIFAKRHHLIRERKKDDKTILKINNGAAYRVFSMQLGPVYTDVSVLPDYVQALFAIFAAKADFDAKNADQLLKQIAISSGRGELDFKGTKELLDKYKDTKIVKRAINRHAYVTTIMASMLEAARTGGVLASAQFLWLKPLDRQFMVCHEHSR